MNVDVDVDVDVRLTALKKAYADVIMNTVKEASARILLCERKAARLQYELNVAREQGIQTLLRLKEMMDAKVSEAEMIFSDQQRKIVELTLQLQAAENIINEGEVTSLNQHRKIEELEAQLQEAEDIVKDLREELPDLQTKLKRARIVNQHYLEQINYIGREENFVTNSISMPASASEDPTLLVKGACMKTASESTLSEIVVQTKDLASSSLNGFINGNDSNKPILPTTVQTSKVSEPLRNRRTQRILAFEEKIMSGELWGGVGRANNKEVVEDCKKTNKKNDMVLIRSTRKKKRTYRKPKTSSLRLLAEQAMIMKQESSLVDGANHTVNQVDAEVTVVDENTKDGCFENKQKNNGTANNVILIKKENDGTTDLIEKHEAAKSMQIVEGTADLPVVSRIFKYTYHRKHKKGYLSPKFDGNVSCAAETAKETFIENQNSPMETDFSFSTESQLNNQHVALVVHQGNYGGGDEDSVI